MPTYVYKCDCGRVDEQIRTIEDRDTLKICKNCRRPMDRDITAFRGAVYAPTSSTSELKV